MYEVTLRSGVSPNPHSDLFGWRARCMNLRCRWSTSAPIDAYQRALRAARLHDKNCTEVRT